MGKGGGSSSGKVSYPVHMENMHHQWLNNWTDDAGNRPFTDGEFPDVATAMLNATTAVGGNPFSGATAYSPDTDIANAQDAVDDLQGDLASGWTAFLTSTMEAIDATIASPVDFDGMSNVISDRIRTEENKSQSRFNARALDIGAIQNSTYAMSLAQLEQATRDRIYEFSTGQEDKILNARLALLGSLGGTRLDGMRAVAAQQGQLSQLTTVAKSEEQQINQQWENAEATWDLDLFQYGSNVLASISGATGSAKGQSQTSLQKGMGAVAMGASTSLAIGAAGGAGLGTGAGALAALGNPVGLGIGALIAGLSFLS